MWYRQLGESVASKAFSVSLTQHQQRFFRRRPKPIWIEHGSTPPEDTGDNSKDTKPKARLTTLLDNASTFEDVHREQELLREPRPGGRTLPTADPFLSSPYTKETKIFQGGKTALDEANRRHLVDPASTSVRLA
jgi:hypothetical protein